MEIAAVGSGRFALGFRLAGVQKTSVASGEKLERRVAELLNDTNVGILVLQNEDAVKMPLSLRRRLSESVSPVVIAIGKSEEVDLRERIKQAVGVDLWKK